MEKKFRLNVYNREPKPRSSRLRGTGVSVSHGGSVVKLTVSGADSAGESHSHDNKADLDKLSTDANDYIFVTQPHDTADGGASISTHKARAGEADHAAKAADLDDDSPVLRRFLSRVADDIAQGRITFQQGLTAVGSVIFKGGAEFGAFTPSLLSGTGAAVDASGNAEVESLRVRSALEVMELIINRLSALEGDQLLTESDSVESVTDNGDGTLSLSLRSKWDGYFTAITPGTVLKGIVNTLASGSGAYRTSWMRVNSVNPPLNRIEVSLYPDAEVPSGTNYPPCELMKIARWGHQTDPNRQSCLYLSSTEGRIVRLVGVTKPIIDSTNYGATFGTLPDFIASDPTLPVIPGQDYVYARGLVAEDIIQIDYQGRPRVTIVDRGPWSATADYYHEERNPATGTYETSDVWYRGCRYRCMTSGTHAAPAWDSTAWAMVEGNPDFSVAFADTDYLFDPDNFNLTLQIIARLHNIDVTADILPSDVVWTRYSEDADGVERTASDTAWALRRAGAGLTLALTTDDIDFNGYMPRTVRFTATVTLRDGMGEAAATEQASFEY
ncbi:MAG: hypothetical protein ACI31E_05950 [Muribaculaceae bacterium]